MMGISPLGWIGRCIGGSEGLAITKPRGNGTRPTSGQFKNQIMSRAPYGTYDSLGLVLVIILASRASVVHTGRDVSVGSIKARRSR